MEKSPVLVLLEWDSFWRSLLKLFLVLLSPLHWFYSTLWSTVSGEEVVRYEVVRYEVVRLWGVRCEGSARLVCSGSKLEAEMVAGSAGEVWAGLTPHYGETSDSTEHFISARQISTWFTLSVVDTSFFHPDFYLFYLWSWLVGQSSDWALVEVLLVQLHSDTENVAITEKYSIHPHNQFSE